MSPDSSAAAIELLYLRGTLPSDIDVPREPIRLSTRPEMMRQVDEPRDVSVSDAIAYLAAQPKPIRCTARLWRGKLSIITGPASAEQLQFHQWSLAIPATKSWEKVNASADDRVVVKSANESVTVPFQAFEGWRRDYVRTGSTMIGGPQATKDLPPTEPRWEAWVGKTGPIGESYALHEDESVLCDRCRQQLAVAVFRDRKATPPTMELLCEDCLRANVGREFAREVFHMDKKLSDEESLKLLDNMFKSMREDMNGSQEAEETGE